MSEHHIRLQVNGKLHTATVSSRLLLSDFLRQNLRLTGTHVGCEHGICGACTISADGRAIRSCLTFAVQMDGAALTTIEGLAENSELHPLQIAFQQCHGLQCGFCTPGFLMTALESYERGDHLDRDEIRELVSGNLCRCTGYETILDAVELAQKLRDEKTEAAHV